jgi:predicted permease
VSPHYFETIGTRIVEGRAIDEQDTPATRSVALVNRFFANKYFKDGHAIGKHFGNDVKHPGYFEIVGVTEDTHYGGPSDRMRPMYFLAQGQSVHSTEPRYQQFEDRSSYLSSIEIQTAGNLPGIETQVRHAVGQINPDLAIVDFTSFAEQVKQNFTQQAMIAKLTSFFGLLALVLASIGLYGVTAYSVERRTSEIGIRMALGANRSSVLRLILRGAFVQVGVGLAIGIPVAILAGHAMASQLFGVKPWDPVTLSITLMVLCAAAFVAALLPARAAAGLEPMRALRTE